MEDSVGGMFFVQGSGLQVYPIYRTLNLEPSKAHPLDPLNPKP